MKIKISMNILDTTKTTWNLKPLFAGNDDPKIQEERMLVAEKANVFVQKWKTRTNYLENPELMKEALDEYEQLMRFHGTGTREEFFFHLQIEVDDSNPILKAKYNQMREFNKKISITLQFFTLQISSIPPNKQRQFLNYPSLEKYRHFLERSFARTHYLLTESEERILTLKNDVSHSKWIKMIKGFLSKEEMEVIDETGNKKIRSFSEIYNLIDHPNKKVRDSAAIAFDNILQKYEDIAEVEINAILENKKIDDELRKVTRPDFLRHLSDDIESDVVDKMLEAVTERYSLSRRYYALKTQLMGVPKLKYHERNVPYGSFDKIYSYAEAAELVYSVLSNLDSEFGFLFKKFVENGRIDVYPRKGKRHGAFCSDALPILPTYILLNHSNRLQDVLTLAHEAGHGINSELMKQKVHALAFETILSTAEVASTFMEDFVLHELMQKAESGARLSLLIDKLNSDVKTIMRQVACYCFEQELHQSYRKKGYLSKEEIGRIFQKHMVAYMGDAVEQSPGSERWWVHWLHIREFFYVYSYASGLLISKTLQKNVRNNPEFIIKVKDFLSAGTSESPCALFRKMGIDISKKQFWREGLDEVEKLLCETEALARKLGKIKKTSATSP